MKLLVFAMGSGEASQAYAIVREARARGDQALLVLRQKENYQFFSSIFSSDSLALASNSEELTNRVKLFSPDSVILCNSKSLNHDTGFVDRSPFPNVPTFTVDSNWLFNEKDEQFHFVKWAERYFINLPPAVFNAGLQENGGEFVISETVRSKIEVVGLIPSYNPLPAYEKENIRRSLGIKADTKFIFCYFSGFGTGARNWVMDKLLSAGKILNEKGIKFLAVYVGKNDQINEKLPDWFHPLDRGGSSVSPEEFYKVLASADLIFQHQGLGTLAQAISARVPVIANVVERHSGVGSYPRLHAGEVGPFQKNGACHMFFDTTTASEVAATIESLLFNSQAISIMKEHQQKLFVRGEAVVINKISERVKG